MEMEFAIFKTTALIRLLAIIQRSRPAVALTNEDGICVGENDLDGDGRCDYSDGAFDSQRAITMVLLFADVHIWTPEAHV